MCCLHRSCSDSWVPALWPTIARHSVLESHVVHDHDFPDVAGGERHLGADQCKNDRDGTVDHDEIAPRAGLAARQMHLQDAKLRRFAENAHPGRGIELVLSRIERERVGAIGAAERTAMGQLGEKPQRLMQHCGN